VGRRKLRVGLLWHSATSGNLGVGALTVSNLAIARQVAEELGADVEFVILGMRDGETPSILGPEVEVRRIDWRYLLSPTGFFREVGRLDCVLDIGGGDSFADIYGGKRFAMIWLSKMLTHVRGRPLILAPQTIGPFNKARSRLLARLAMKPAAAVVARDRTSFSFARQLAPQTRTLLSADVAFVLPFEDRSEQRGSNTGGKLRVGINASGLLFEEAVRGGNRFNLAMDYARFTRSLLSQLSDRGDVELHLIAHATSSSISHDDDGALADRIAAEFPATIRVPNFATPSDAKSYISGLDFLVASRMHACIAAFSAGVPVVPVAYSRKFEGVFGLLDYNWTVPVKGMSEEVAIDYIMDALDRRSELERDEARGMAVVAPMMDEYRAVLGDVFGQFVGKQS